jgi:hypothetical protein
MTPAVSEEMVERLAMVRPRVESRYREVHGDDMSETDWLVFEDLYAAALSAALPLPVEGPSAVAVKTLTKALAIAHDRIAALDGVNNDDLVAILDAAYHLSTLAPSAAAECASEGCGRPSAVHFIRGGIGSYYCHECYQSIFRNEQERLALTSPSAEAAQPVADRQTFDEWADQFQAPDTWIAFAREAWNAAQPQGELREALDALAWVETWVSNPVGSYSVQALDGLFAMTRDRLAALAGRTAG